MYLINILNNLNVILYNILSRIYYIMYNKNKMMSLNDVDFFLNDDNYKHFQSLPPMKQEAIKQIMQLEYLKNMYDK